MKEEQEWYQRNKVRYMKEVAVNPYLLTIEEKERLRLCMENCKLTQTRLSLTNIWRPYLVFIYRDRNTVKNNMFPNSGMAIIDRDDG